MRNRTKKVVVIGAGIAGLSAAHYLRKHGIDVFVLEREKFVGGVMRTTLKEERYIIELGPNTFQAGSEPIVRLTNELSIAPLIVGSDALSRYRYVWSGGKMRRVPTSMPSSFTSNLASLAGKIKLFSKLLAQKQPSENEALENYILPKIVVVESEFGKVFDKHGLLSFRWGMGTITARLEEELRSRVQVGTEATSIERRKDGGLKIYIENHVVPVEADAIIIATPSFFAARLLTNLAPQISESLASIPYSPIAVVHTSFGEKDVHKKLDGFGVLVSRHEGIRMIGSIWSSAIFPVRCPKGEILLTNFIGGPTDPLILELPDNEIIDEVLAGLNKVMGIYAKPRFVYLKRWLQAIPQNIMGHESKLEQIGLGLAKLPGVFITGSYFSGASVSDTIAHARSEVDRVVAHLKN